MTVGELKRLLQDYDSNMIVAFGYDDTNEVIDSEDILVNDFVNDKGIKVQELVFDTGASLG